MAQKSKHSLDGWRRATHILTKDEHGDYNLIEIDGDRVRIKEADCDDQICVRRGWATKNGETIVCLPHKLVIEVRSTDGGDEDSLIY